MKLSVFLTIAVAAGAIALDAVGLALNSNGMLRAGGVLGWAVVALGFLALACVTTPGRRILWLLAVLLFALARWVRGSAAVPPDPPLLAAQLVSLLLFVLCWTLDRRAKRE